MAERSLGVRETPGSIPGSPNRGYPARPMRAGRERPPKAAPPFRAVFFVRPPRIVFVYGDRPSGHSAVAAALRDELLKQAPKVQASELAFSSEVAPVVGPMVSAAYLSLIQKTPKLWNYLYDNRTVAKALKEIREPLSALHRLKLRRCFKALEPDLIVCTHALACAVLETDKKLGLLAAPMAAILTDYGVHEYWVSSGPDLYAVPSGSVREELIARGAAPERVVVTGIPVHPRFRRLPARGAARRAFKLPAAAPVILLEGGTRGLGPIQETLDAVLACRADACVLVVCGRNRDLLAELSSRYRANARVRLLGYTRRMPECYAAADLLVGKPGGVTASEAAACGLPLVIVSPLPGQEMRNCAYLTQRGAALPVERAGKLGATVASLLGSPKRLAAMRAAARDAAPIDSARRVVKALLGLLAQRPVGPKAA